MSRDYEGYLGEGVIAAQARAEVRAEFISKTYAHLAGAIFAFVGLLALLVNSQLGMSLAASMLQGSWLLVLVGFMVVAYVADRWAQSQKSVGMQYLGLGLYVVAEAIIFLPLVALATVHRPDAIGPAAVLTLVVFGGLTAYVFITKSDFSWLRSGLAVAGFVALGLIVVGVIWGGGLGLWFSGLMVAFAAACVLYSTSMVLHTYPVGSHVAAALSLFASIALMFWYILQIFMSSRD